MKSNNDKPSVHVTALSLTNFMGLASAKIEPGKVTLVKGSNGVGKTTILEAFKSVLRGGHDGTLLRNGEEFSEVGLVLSNRVEIKKRITPADSKTQVTHPEFGKLSKPATYLDNLRDAFAINPVEFLTARPERRVELLLSAIPLVLNPVDLKGIVEYCSTQPDLSRHALQVLAGIDKDLRDQRTGVNRSAKDKRSSIEELKKALPAEASADGKKVLELVESEYSDFRTKNDAARNAIITKAAQEVSALKDELRIRIADADRAYNEELAKLRAKYEAGNDALKAANQQECADVDRIANKKLGELATDRTDKSIKFESTLATARANADAYTRAQTARDHIKRMEDGATALETDSESLSSAIAELENVRGNLLESLPIKGVTLSDGEILVDGIAFDRVNESRRMRLAIEIALLRCGNLPLIVVDGAEALDARSLQALADAAVEMGVQMVLGIVQDGEDGTPLPLQVEKIA